MSHEASPTALRCLVACRNCRRQLEAGGLAAGSRFHCHCGEILEVPRFRPHDADVVRCSSCSAPRREGAATCRHCGADYTLHERDLHTICPGCMTRVSDKARYCHHCATPIVPQGHAGSPTARRCPACAGAATLNSRALGDPAVAVSECPGCAGLWLGTEAFQLLADRARDESVDDPALFDAGRSAPAETAPRSGAFYRPCPECGKSMNRRNFGQRSGVLVDACREHGIWFDSSELSATLSWIRRGGEERAAARSAAESRHAERQARIRIERPAQPGEARSEVSLGRALLEGEGRAGWLALLFDL